LEYSPHLEVALKEIYLRLAYLILCVDRPEMLDGLDERHRMKLGLDDTYNCSMTFIDEVSCVFWGFHKSLLIRNVVAESSSLEELNWMDYDEKSLSQGIEKWIEFEGQTIADDTFKDNLRQAGIGKPRLPKPKKKLICFFLDRCKFETWRIADLQENGWKRFSIQC